jgi:phosphonoacetaldehyde hydrolase
MTQSIQSGGVQAVIFDISGTVIDYGSRGPVVAFVELFARHGVAVTETEARLPMGAHKKDHIRAMLHNPDVASRWAEAIGAAPTDADLEALYSEFTPLQVEVLERHSDVLPGVRDVVAGLRRRGIRIANTTGFDSAMIPGLTRLAAEGGYTSDLWVTPDLVGKGRPAPWMAFYAAHKLGVYPMSTFVKVGDTLADIAEAHAAGMWAVSVLRHGNEVGLSQEALEALSPAEQEERISAARARLAAKGPHYIIETTAQLLPVIDEISSRIARGERP